MPSLAETIITRLGHPFAVAMLVVGGYAAADWPLVGQAAALLTILYCLPLEQAFPRTAEWKLNLPDVAQATTWNVLLDRIVYPVTFAFCIIPLVGLLSGFRDTLNIPKIWPADWPLAVRAGLALVLFQVVAYWMHRATHRWAFLWRAHGVHHHLTKLTALTGTINGVFDGIAITIGWVPLIVLGLDFQHELMPLIVITNGINILAHANVRFELPRWYRRTITTNAEHAVHHSIVLAEQNSNYACYFVFVDRLFGTYLEGDTRKTRVAGAGKGTRLTVMQQILFPFRRAKNFEAPLPWERRRAEALPRTEAKR
jgi:sterol desaturase/sphingolipid hydroxylase (fatty acid hydroxylase superfamily)